MDVKIDNFPEWLRNRPGPDCTSPRDGAPLWKTGDFLFLASLLSHAPSIRYFLSDRATGAVIPLRDDLQDAMLETRKSTTQRIARSTIRQWFREVFFPFRKLLRLMDESEAEGLTIMVDASEMHNASGWRCAEMQRLNENLKWPFSRQRQNDSLLDNLHTVSLMGWEAEVPLKESEVYCPVDGPVTPLTAEIMTPSLTWQSLCGRRWRLFVCPYCLGQFSKDLVCLN